MRPTRGSGFGGSIDEDACVTEGEGPVDDDDEIHAANTDVAATATIGTATRAVMRICNSGEGAGERN
jgi:hypothetical protein